VEAEASTLRRAAGAGAGPTFPFSFTLQVRLWQSR
jgi:hypothetical protein